MLKKAGWVVLGVVVVAATWLIVRRLLVTDRDRVARVVQGLVRHIERRDAPSFCLLLAEGYTDSHGHNRAAMRARLAAGLPQFQSLSIRVVDLEIEVTGDRARAEFVAEVFARGRAEQRGWRWTTPVRLFVERAGREWRVVEAEYRLPGRVQY